MQFSYKRIAKYIHCLLACALFSSKVFAFDVEINKAVKTNNKVLDVTVFTDIKNTQHLSLSYLATPRLNQVVTDAVSWAREQNKSVNLHETDAIYWQSASLFAANKEKINQQIAEILQQIDSVQNIGSSQIKNAIDNLKSFIRSSTFKERLALPVELDYHLAGGGYSGGGKINPQLSGRYQLFLPKKPTHVWIIGAVEMPGSTPFESMKNADDYLKKTQLINSYGQSDVWVIEPNGKQQKQGIAYWNKTHTFILPGSIIFVPFNAFPTQLNQAISALLQHRVMSL